MTYKQPASQKNAYTAKMYDRLQIFAPKGRKDVIQAAASAQGESINKFVCQAVDERIERLQAQKQSKEKPG